MPFTPTVKERFVHIAWHGNVTQTDLMALGQELPKIAASLGCAPDVLHTFGELGDKVFTPWAAFEHSIRRETTPMKNVVKSAVVATTPQVLAVARMMQALNRNPGLTMEIFSSETDALAWLNGT